MRPHHYNHFSIFPFSYMVLWNCQKTSFFCCCPAELYCTTNKVFFNSKIRDLKQKKKYLNFEEPQTRTKCAKILGIIASYAELIFFDFNSLIFTQFCCIFLHFISIILRKLDSNDNQFLQYTINAKLL
jgi:hypothetical protein